MATWNNNDREESKPSWLTKSQKINCVRTVAGWELPLHGNNLGGEFGGLGGTQGMDKQGLGLTQSTKHTELLVAMPVNFVYDPNIVLSLTGSPALFHYGIQGTTGFSLTAGTQLYYYDQNSGTPFTVGTTAGVEAIGKIVAATAAAGAWSVQIGSFFNNGNNVLSGPKDVEVNGIFLCLNTATTGSTASVSSITRIIEGGYTASNLFTDRITATGGTGAGGEAANFRPYITCPFNGDSCSSTGQFVYNGVGLSFGTSLTGGGQTYGSVAGTTNSGYFGVGVYDLSTLNFPGATSYIKVVANDSNFTQNLTFSLQSNVAGGATYANQQITAARIYQGISLVNGTIPTGVYEAFFGPTASVNNNIGVVQILKSGATANSQYKMTVRVTDNGAGGLTADSTFTVSFGAAS